MKNKILTFAVFVLTTHVTNAVESTLKDIEHYLNNITTLEADFQQYAPGTAFTSGTFYLNRPKKFLWQYKLPHQQKLVSTGSRLFFHDPQTEQTTQLPLNSGFAALLTKVPFSLSEGDFMVHSFLNKDGITIIELSEANENSDGRFILKFTQEPINLVSMSSKDNFGQGVSVLFSNHKQGQKLNEALFKFTPALEDFSLDN